MIKKIWDAIHFGRFKSQWRNDLPEQMSGPRTELGRTLLYETYLHESEDGYELVTENGGYIGKYAFYAAIPVYIALLAGMIFGGVHLVHILMLELCFIGVFGLLNGWALHQFAKEPAFGVEELSLHRIESR